MEALIVLFGFAAVASLYTAFTRPEMHVVRRGVARTRRVMRTTRVSKISELVDGKLACVVDTVERDDHLLTSILTRKPCVAYEIVEWRRGVRRKLVPFVVNDGSGRVRVDAAEAALLNPPSEQGETFEERVIPIGAVIRIVGSVRLEPAMKDAREHGYREHAVTATLTGTAKYPLLVDVEAAK